MKVTQVKSQQRRPTSASCDTLRSLGLRRIGHTVEVKDTPQARGMVHRVRHLVKVEDDEPSPSGARRRPRSIGLHTLKPPRAAARPRKRVGRGEGSGTGKTAGRGQKGAGSRSGAKDRARFEGGQMPIHMRMRKLRGPHMKKSMPFEPFRTHTQPVNLLDLERALRRGRRGHARGAQGQGPRDAQGHPGQGARQGRAHQAAHRPRPRLQRVRARTRSRPPAAPASGRRAASLGGAAMLADDPQRLHGRGDPQEARRSRRRCSRSTASARTCPVPGSTRPGGRRRSRSSSAAAASSTC